MKYADQDLVQSNPDYYFRHFFRDVVVLLGGKMEIADLLDKSQDGVTEAEVDAVRNYACDLVTDRKKQLASLHKMQIRVEPDESA